MARSPPPSTVKASTQTPRLLPPQNTKTSQTHKITKPATATIKSTTKMPRTLPRDPNKDIRGLPQQCQTPRNGTMTWPTFDSYIVGSSSTSKPTPSPLATPTNTMLLAVLNPLRASNPYLGRSKVLQALHTEHNWAISDKRLKAFLAKHNLNAITPPSSRSSFTGKRNLGATNLVPATPAARVYEAPLLPENPLLAQIAYREANKGRCFILWGPKGSKGHFGVSVEPGIHLMLTVHMRTIIGILQNHRAVIGTVPQSVLSDNRNNSVRILWLYYAEAGRGAGIKEEDVARQFFAEYRSDPRSADSISSVRPGNHGMPLGERLRIEIVWYLDKVHTKFPHLVEVNEKGEAIYREEKHRITALVLWKVDERGREHGVFGGNKSNMEAGTKTEVQRKYKVPQVHGEARGEDVKMAAGSRRAVQYTKGEEDYSGENEECIDEEAYDGEDEDSTECSTEPEDLERNRSATSANPIASVDKTIDNMGGDMSGTVPVNKDDQCHEEIQRIFSPATTISNVSVPIIEIPRYITSNYQAKRNAELVPNHLTLIRTSVIFKSSKVAPEPESHPPPPPSDPTPSRAEESSFSSTTKPPLPDPASAIPPLHVQNTSTSSPPPLARRLSKSKNATTRRAQKIQNQASLATSSASSRVTTRPARRMFPLQAEEDRVNSVQQQQQQQQQQQMDSRGSHRKAARVVVETKTEQQDRRGDQEELEDLRLLGRLRGRRRERSS